MASSPLKETHNSADLSIPSVSSDFGPAELLQIVRFASSNQEIEPPKSIPSGSQEAESGTLQQELSPEAQDELRSLSLNLEKSRIQARRMSSFAFEPVSLPVSRSQSHEVTPQNTRPEPPKMDAVSPKGSPSASNMPTPPLTPSGTHGKDQKASDGIVVTHGHGRSDPVRITPQTSDPGTSPPPPGEASSSTIATSGDESRFGDGSTAPSSKSQGSHQADSKVKKGSGFSIGPSGSTATLYRSQEDSQDGGESQTSTREAETTSTAPAAHAASYPRPSPHGEHNDPYARSKRPPQPKSLGDIENRFVFGKNDQRRRSGVGFGSTSGTTSPVPRSNSGTDLKNEHRQSTFSRHSVGGRKDSTGHADEKHHHNSMSELKRFFFGGHHKTKRSQSPSASAKAATKRSASGARTPPHQAPPSNVPFADDHGLVNKYGKFGKILGSGAGGSVRLMKRSSDGVTFAVKQFRDRHPYETEKDYNKKVTAEFCIGSTLHHGNIIETLDIIHEGGRWYEVMEYAPFDLFAIVMTGKMSREEVNCCFLQIFAGVKFLHSMGLAHRDLKLDNVVVNSEGIMKLIDFGSAVVFRYPFENDVIMASGVVGSDPYLAPEVYDNAKYNPEPVDVWSLAIIYACMALRRFPWKMPRMSDNSYKLFAAPPSPGTPGGPEPSKTPAETSEEGRDSESVHHGHGHHHHHHHENAADGEQKSASTETNSTKSDQKQEVIKGPWRLLRLLPRETRTIMGQMLDLDPKKRATLEDMAADSWIKGSPVCEQLEGGKVVHHGTHQHTLEPGSSQPSAK